MSDRATQKADNADKRAAHLAQMKKKKRGGLPGNRNARRERAVLGPHLKDREQVVKLTGFSYPYLLEAMKEGRFPRARRWGNRNVWLSAEVEQWMASLPLSPLTNVNADPAEKETAQRKAPGRDAERFCRF
jgi:predicted DNA-binding transcriptional regulator AlpA